MLSWLFSTSSFTDPQQSTSTQTPGLCSARRASAGESTDGWQPFHVKHIFEMTALASRIKSLKQWATARDRAIPRAMCQHCLCDCEVSPRKKEPGFVLCLYRQSPRKGHHSRSAFNTTAHTPGSPGLRGAPRWLVCPLGNGVARILSHKCMENVFSL